MMSERTKVSEQGGEGGDPASERVGEAAGAGPPGRDEVRK